MFVGMVDALAAQVGRTTPSAPPRRGSSPGGISPGRRSCSARAMVRSARRSKARSKIARSAARPRLDASTSPAPHGSSSWESLPAATRPCREARGRRREGHQDQRAIRRGEFLILPPGPPARPTTRKVAGVSGLTAGRPDRHLAQQRRLPELEPGAPAARRPPPAQPGGRGQGVRVEQRASGHRGDPRAGLAGDGRARRQFSGASAIAGRPSVPHGTGERASGRKILTVGRAAVSCKVNPTHFEGHHRIVDDQHRASPPSIPTSGSSLPPPSPFRTTVRARFCRLSRGRSEAPFRLGQLFSADRGLSGDRQPAERARRTAEPVGDREHVSQADRLHRDEGAEQLGRGDAGPPRRGSWAPSRAGS